MQQPQVADTPAPWTSLAAAAGVAADASWLLGPSRATLVLVSDLLELGPAPALLLPAELLARSSSMSCCRRPTTLAMAGRWPGCCCQQASIRDHTPGGMRLGQAGRWPPDTFSAYLKAQRAAAESAEHVRHAAWQA
jgi:hypothetical protein